MYGLSLCAGIGGLDLGPSIAIPTYRTVCYVEREAYAAATLVARMEEQTLAPAPIWDDVSTFPGRDWHGAVDLVAAGFPCQPFSNAGKRRGTDDTRWLWHDIARILGEVRPRYVFLENVRGFTAPAQRDALAAVLGTLADLGFDAEWDVFSAAEVGAPHRRERWFLLAHTTQHGRHEGRTKPARQPRRPDDAERRGKVGHPDESGLAGWKLSFTQGTDQRPAWPPGPEVGPCDWPEGEPEPAVRREADGSAPGLEYRQDRLRALGNGVVPLQAAYAFRTLATRLGLVPPTNPH